LNQQGLVGEVNGLQRDATRLPVVPARTLDAGLVVGKIHTCLEELLGVGVGPRIRRVFRLPVGILQSLSAVRLDQRQERMLPASGAGWRVVLAPVKIGERPLLIALPADALVYMPDRETGTREVTVPVDPPSGGLVRPELGP